MNSRFHQLKEQLKNVVGLSAKQLLKEQYASAPPASSLTAPEEQEGSISSPSSCSPHHHYNNHDDPIHCGNENQKHDRYARGPMPMASSGNLTDGDKTKKSAATNTTNAALVTTSMIYRSGTSSSTTDHNDQQRLAARTPSSPPQEEASATTSKGDQNSHKNGDSVAIANDPKGNVVGISHHGATQKNIIDAEDDHDTKKNKKAKKNDKEHSSFMNPTHHDVLCGRGNAVHNHSGNKYYRTIVRKYFTAYMVACKTKKVEVAFQIVDEIESNERDPPGRFVKYNRQGNYWHEITRKEKLSKVRQALREGASTARLLQVNEMNSVPGVSPISTKNKRTTTGNNHQQVNNNDRTKIITSEDKKINDLATRTETQKNKIRNTEKASQGPVIAINLSEEGADKKNKADLRPALTSSSHKKSAAVKHKSDANNEATADIYRQQEVTPNKYYEEASAKEKNETNRPQSQEEEQSSPSNKKDGGSSVADAVVLKKGSCNEIDVSSDEQQENSASRSVPSTTNSNSKVCPPASSIIKENNIILPPSSSGGSSTRADDGLTKSEKNSRNVSKKRKHCDITMENYKNNHDKPEEQYNEEVIVTKEQNSNQSRTIFETNSCSKCKGKGVVRRNISNSTQQIAPACVPKNYGALPSREHNYEQERNIDVLRTIHEAEQYFDLAPSHQTYPQRIHAIQQKVFESCDERTYECLAKALEYSEESTKVVIKCLVEVENNWGIVGTENVSIFNRINIIETTALKYKKKLDSLTLLLSNSSANKKLNT